jgi:hypothetical protein
LEGKCRLCFEHKTPPNSRSTKNPHTHTHTHDHTHTLQFCTDRHLEPARASYLNEHLNKPVPAILCTARVAKQASIQSKKGMTAACGTRRTYVLPKTRSLHTRPLPFPASRHDALLAPPRISHVSCVHIACATHTPTSSVPRSALARLSVCL